MALHARNAANSLAQLALAAREQCSEAEGAVWDMLPLAGGAVAFTVQWTSEGRIDMRMGTVVDNEDPVCLLMLDFPAQPGDPFAQ